jgi:hypothetical protein
VLQGQPKDKSSAEATFLSSVDSFLLNRSDRSSTPAALASSPTGHFDSHFLSSSLTLDSTLLSPTASHAGGDGAGGSGGGSGGDVNTTAATGIFDASFVSQPDPDSEYDRSVINYRTNPSDELVDDRNVDDVILDTNAALVKLRLEWVSHFTHMVLNHDTDTLPPYLQPLQDYLQHCKESGTGTLPEPDNQGETLTLGGESQERKGNVDSDGFDSEEEEGAGATPAPASGMLVHHVGDDHNVSKNQV